jgi:hypothetical protein
VPSSKHLKRRSCEQHVSPLCSVAALSSDADNRDNYCEQWRQHVTNGTVARSDIWDLVCACHHHSRTTAGRSTDNKSVEESRHKEAPTALQTNVSTLQEATKPAVEPESRGHREAEQEVAGNVEQDAPELRHTLPDSPDCARVYKI